MKYNYVTYNFDKKNDRYRFYYESEYFENGHHIQSGNLFDVYMVNSHYVVMKYISQPVHCCDTFDQLLEYIEKLTKCKADQK